MSDGDSTIINDHNNTNHFSHTDLTRDVQLQLQYKDQRKGIEKYLKNAQCSPTATIGEVIKEFLKCINLEHVLPVDVKLVDITHDTKRFSVPVENAHMTLNELNIVNGCTLCFTPLAPLVTEEPLSLSIWSPNDIDKVNYTWYKNTTTLGMLLEHIIQIFSLMSIERERIHLFYKADELDLMSNYDNLLSELGIGDYDYIDVKIIPSEPYLIWSMTSSTSNGFLSPLNGQSNTTYSLHTELNSSILLTLRYTDHFQNLDKTETHRFLPTTTIYDVAKQLLKLVHLDHLRPEDVNLVEYGFNKRYKMSSDNVHKTLKELAIIDGYTLYFEPASTSLSTNPWTLTVIAQNGLRIAKYEWDKTTTFDMLFDYVIKEFGLQSIERKRIRLTSYLNKEFDCTLHSGRLLSELGITDNYRIYIKVIQSDLSSASNERYNVRVECIANSGIRTLNVPHTVTIEELKKQIEKEFEERRITDLKLLNNMHYRLNTSDQTRTLSDLGVVPGETIDAQLTLTHCGNPLSRLNTESDKSKGSSSIIAKHEPNEVTVNCMFSTFESNIIKASVNDTVAELIRKIEALAKTRPLAKFEMWCGSNDIDAEQPNRRLSDFGIQAGDTIRVDVKNEFSRKYALAEPARDSTSLKLDTSSISHRITSSPVGLSNIGNTCYMNSALQCLAHAKPLTQFFLDALTQDVSDGEKCIDNDWNYFYTFGSVTGAYADLLKNLWLPTKTLYYSSSFRPSHIKETIGVHAPRFATDDQQDAQEFMTCLLDEIHKELKDKKEDGESSTIIENLFFGKLKSTITCLDCQHQVTTINPISFLPLPLNQQGCMFSVKFITKDGGQDLAIVNVPENGQVKNIIEAYVESRPLEYFWRTIIVMTDDGPLDSETPLDQLHIRDVVLIEQDDILLGSLSYKRNDRYSKKLTVQECLREFFSIENLEDSWLCQQNTCKKHTKATKQLQLCTLPPILIIQLKRFSQENGLRHKIETFVDYPIYGLDLSSVLSSSEEAIYDLFAVCNHTGSIYGGHYIAYARHEANGKNEWYKFDDFFVSSVYFDSEIVSRDAYLLFYIKRNKSKQSTAVTTSEYI